MFENLNVNILTTDFGSMYEKEWKDISLLCIWRFFFIFFFQLGTIMKWFRVSIYGYFLIVIRKL